MARLGIVGAKNSGKTTLIEQLIPLLISRGLKVSSVKHTSHDHCFDTPGKDSHRHRKVGADQTLVASSAEIALFGRLDPDLQQDLEIMIEQRSDIILVEGDKYSDSSKLLLTRNIDQLAVNEIDHVIATYGEQETDRSVPHLRINDLDQVAEFVADFLSQTQASGEGHA